MRSSIPSVLALTSLVLGGAALGACSSGSSKTTNGASPKPKPTTSAPAPAPKPTAGSKPSGSAKAPTPPPPGMAPTSNLPQAYPLSDPSDLANDNAFSLGDACPTGLAQGTGFCYPDLPAYVDGCTADGKYKTLLCTTYNDGDKIGFCDVISGAVGCWWQPVTPVASDDFGYATDQTIGHQVDASVTRSGLAVCDGSAKGKGYCDGDDLYVCNADGTMWGMNCKEAYGTAANRTCGASSDGSSIGCF
jgi:hypothetical protein